MSTVLWAYKRVGGVATSDDSDKHALYKHGEKLDEIALRVHRKSFLGLCDTTDLEFNMNDEELPPGMTSSEELMAKSGKWMAAADAVELLGALIGEIESKKLRFGLLKNDHDDVVAELKESLEYAQEAAREGGSFNFSVVM